MKFKHARWTKNYPDEHGAFARLPWFARAAARQLQGACDDAGRIDVGDGPEDEIVSRLVATIAFRQGATRGDRRMMAMMFPLLFSEGYLVARGRFAVVRNFVAAQRRWDGEEESPGATIEQRTDHEPTTNEPPSSNEPTTTVQRTDHDSATNEQRERNEPTTTPELSARKHTIDDASARARAHSSVPFRSESLRSEGERSGGAIPVHPPVDIERGIRPIDGESLLAALNVGAEGAIRGIVGCDASLILRVREVCERRNWAEQQMRRVGEWLIGDDAPDWIARRRDGDGLSISWLMRENGQRFVELCDAAKESFERRKVAS